MRILPLALTAALLATTTPALAVELIPTTAGALQSGDLIMSPRLFRDALPSTWAAPKPFPGLFGAGNYYFDLVSVGFAPNATQDIYYEIEIGMTNANDVFAAAYNSSFLTANFATNYLGDHGSSNSGVNVFQVMVPTGGSLLLNIHSVTTTDVIGAGVRNYTYRVQAFSDANRGEAFNTQVSEPATLALLGAGLFGLGMIRRRKTAH